jgi:hypothetical protein
MLERRALQRHEVRFDSKLIFVDASRVVDCTLSNMTEDGARIRTADEVAVPSRFYVWERQTNSVFECELRWRKRRVLGVRFLDTCGRLMRQAIVEACARPAAVPTSQVLRSRPVRKRTVRRPRCPPKGR